MSDLNKGQFKTDNMSGWIGGVVSAGAGLVNSIISGVQNRKLRKLQVLEAQKNRDWQEEMYTKYQSPQAQADQMAASGMNPYAHTESPSSVGSGSTASISAGQPIDVYSPVAGAVTQIQDARLKSEQIKQMQQQTESIYLDNVRKAFDNGNAAEVYKKQMEILESELRAKILTEQEFQKRVDMLQLEYDQRKESADNGVNPFEDAHNESVARVDQIRANIASAQIDDDIKSFALSLSKKFDEKFMQLDYDRKSAELSEFLQTSEHRVTMSRIQADLTKIAKNAALRADALDSIQNETERIFASQILDAALDGKSTFDATFLKWLQTAPQSAAQTITSIISVLK